MRFKSNFHLVFPYKTVDQITWPDGWGHQCAGNMAAMLCEVLKVKSIGSEWKCILSERHRWQVIRDYNITYQEMEDYLKSDCYMLFFSSENILKRTIKALKKMGAENLISTDNYRDMLLQQAYYNRNNKFAESAEELHQFHDNNATK